MPKTQLNGYACSYLLIMLSFIVYQGCRESYRYSIPHDRYNNDETIEMHQSIPSTDTDETSTELSGTWSDSRTRLLRLTSTQLISKFTQLFGPEVRPTTAPPKDLVIEGSIALGTSKVTTTERDAELFARMSEEVAEQIVMREELISEFHSCFQTPNEQFYNELSNQDDYDFWFVCLAQMTDHAAQRIWGRKLKTIEWSSAYRLIGQGLGQLKVPQTTFSFVLSWLLQSPMFLYRVETRQDNGVLTNRTLATKLSYFLTNAPPSPQLRHLNNLQTRSGWIHAVDHLLDAPELEKGIRAMITDLWSLWKLDQLHLHKDPETFEHLSTQLSAAAKEETLMTLWEATDSETYLPTIFTQKRTYVDKYLAALYEIPAPREGFAWVDLPSSSQRSGLLGQLSFLGLNAHPTSTSSTLRGYFVLDKLLCIPPPPPPAEVDTSIPEPTPDRPTLRDRLESHLVEPNCAGCHRPMDMIGLTFEIFDGLARERTIERGVEIDTQGELLGDMVTGPQELAEVLSHHPMLSQCLTTRLFRYARAEHEVDTELSLIQKLAADVESKNFTLKSLLREIALSEGFHGPFLD